MICSLHFVLRVTNGCVCPMCPNFFIVLSKHPHPVVTSSACGGFFRLVVLLLYVGHTLFSQCGIVLSICKCFMSQWQCIGTVVPSLLLTVSGLCSVPRLIAIISASGWDSTSFVAGWTKAKSEGRWWSWSLSSLLSSSYPGRYLVNQILYQCHVGRNKNAHFWSLRRLSPP